MGEAELERRLRSSLPPKTFVPWGFLSQFPFHWAGTSLQPTSLPSFHPTPPLCDAGGKLWGCLLGCPQTASLLPVGANGQVSYGGLAGGPFSIDPQTGLIVTTRALDREQQEQHLLTGEGCWGPLGPPPLGHGAAAAGWGLRGTRLLEGLSVREGSKHEQWDGLSPEVPVALGVWFGGHGGALPVPALGNLRGCFQPQ